MQNDIHETVADEHAKPPWYESATYKSCLAAAAVLRWVIVAVVFSFGAYMYQRDVNAQQTVNVGDLDRRYTALAKTLDERTAARDKQMERLVTTERFDERTTNISQRLERIEARQEEILMRLNPRP